MTIQIEARKRAFPQKSPIEVVDIPQLSPEEFAKRRMRLGVTMQQLTMLTDVGRQRISRIEKGDPASLITEGGKSFVPRSLVLALMGLEDGRFIKH